MERHFWSLRTNLVYVENKDFYRSSVWDCCFIIRPIGLNRFAVYDTRQYSNMESVDFQFHGYSRLKVCASLAAAKKYTAKLYKEMKREEKLSQKGA